MTAQRLSEMKGRPRGNKSDTLCVKCCSRDAPISKSGLCQKCTAASQKRDKSTVAETSESVHGTSTKNGQTTKNAENCSKNRCVMCGKKLGVIAFECYCGKAFCNMHRMPEDHKCTFDFKKLGREMVRKNNPKILPRKIEKL
ncbi:zf-AN1 domain containing protein [Trichuris trichiura]|uniref:Zf-AN1 domain containing protein n=1 Tax=Trichuris trichiura TaxID=36087 RepID=A0A077ZE51_TRITR|nr:zf-AN1 domain containing protein [Trichuris trichiura]